MRWLLRKMLFMFCERETIYAAHADTAPMAICLAALKAVGVEV